MAQTMLTITGRVAQAPKLCTGKTNGALFSVVTVAVNNQRYDKEKEAWIDTDTTFYDLVCFGPLGGNVLRTLSVGDAVVATGRFRVSSWEGEGFKSQTPTLTVENVGPDLRFGHADYTRGQAGYGEDRVDQEVDWPAVHGSEQPQGDDDPGEDQGIPTDADGVVSEEDAQAHLARSA